MSTPNQHYAILMDAALFEIEERNFPAARAHLELARYGNPTSPAPLIALGFVHHAEGNRESAAGQFSDACRLAPNDPLPRICLAELEAQGEGFHNAAIGADKILHGLPNDKLAILAMLQFRDCSGETKRAAAELAGFVRRTGDHGLAKAVADLLRYCGQDKDAVAMEAMA